MASIRPNPCLQNLPQVLHQPYQITGTDHQDPHVDHLIAPAFDSVETRPGSDSTALAKSSSLLYNLSILRDRLHQVQSLVTLIVSPDQAHPEPSSVVAASMGTLIQEIIFTASSMMFTCQQMANNNNNNNNISDSGQIITGNPHQPINRVAGNDYNPELGVDWYSDHHDVVRSMAAVASATTTTSRGDRVINSSSNIDRNSNVNTTMGAKRDRASSSSNNNNYDIIELDAAELLAKYTHYCEICGKGFKRDANLRMHMRAHGDEYKSSSALTNPFKKRNPTNSGGSVAHRESSDRAEDDKLPVKKYSCPQEGCRWNQRHEKFLPLKSMVCVKNHYKRSHCPKMYVCKQCNLKQFSVLSDLRTHEKHCGDIKWQCSCGTTFSRKDKLMGHVALFTGHSPVVGRADAATARKVGQWVGGPASSSSMHAGGGGRGNL